jgi:hypothetical protein
VIFSGNQLIFQGKYSIYIPQCLQDNPENLTETSRMKHLIVMIAAGLLFPVTADSQACTTIGMRNATDRFVAKSYDWSVEEAFVMTNKKGQRKQALVFNAGEIPAQWTSKYNSITFNQYGREFPNAGMNETGLVAEVMVLDSSTYPAADQRPVINETQIVQQVLDRASNVAEALALFRASRLNPVMVQLHYLICDLNECAVVEYRGGREKIYQGSDAPHFALANHDYDASLRHLSLYKGFGGNRSIPARSTDSLRRFAIAASAARSFGTSAPSRSVDQVFQELQRVETDSTQWMIVYDQANKKISYKTRSGRSVKSMDAGLAGPLMSGTCHNANTQVLPMIGGHGGDQTRNFRAYRSDENTRIIRKHLTGQVPAAVIAAAITYPESVVCQP